MNGMPNEEAVDVGFISQYKSFKDKSDSDLDLEDDVENDDIGE